MASDSSEKTITILHFNDVYNIEARAQEPVGGATRFATAVRQLRHLDPLVLFSGDAFNPSIMSTYTNGEHMVPVLNALGVHCAVLGNHDFDCGVDTLVKLVEQTKFPWLMSNVYDLIGGTPLANGKLSTIIEWKGIKLENNMHTAKALFHDESYLSHAVKGLNTMKYFIAKYQKNWRKPLEEKLKWFKIGFVGLVEEEWIATLGTIDPNDVVCLDFIQEGKRLAQDLRSQGAEYIIALTHMRWPNDIRLAENVSEIDLILGGHDHDFTVKQVNNKYVIKSGTDFRYLGHITLTFKKDGRVEVTVKEIEINSSLEEDEEMKLIVKKFTDIVGSKLESVLGNVAVELDGRFSAVRTSETNLGNFVADIMLSATNADAVILNSGTLRSDCIHPKGEFKIKDLMNILPTMDQLSVLKINGEQLVRALENGVSKYPVHEGRFPQVAGITFGFDPTKPPGKRIDPKHVKVGGEYVQLDKSYRLSTKGYLAGGKDGYTVFNECDVIVPTDEGPSLTTVIQNHFRTVMVIRSIKKLQFRHHQSIIPLNQRTNIAQQQSTVDSGGDQHRAIPSQIAQLFFPPSSHYRDLFSPEKTRSVLQRRETIDTAENELADGALAPEVEGRIFIVTDENRQALDDSYIQCHNVQKMTILETDEQDSEATK